VTGLVDRNAGGVNGTSLCGRDLVIAASLLAAIGFMTFGQFALLRVAHGIGIALLVFESRHMDRDWLAVMWVTMILTLFLTLHGSVYGEWRVLGYTVYLLSASGVALAIHRGGLHRGLVWALLLAFAVFFIGRLAQGVLPNEVLPLRSRNHISVIVLSLALLINILEVREGRRVSLPPSLVAVALSILAVGRSGILASSLYAMGVLFLRPDLLVPSLRKWMLAGGVAFVLVWSFSRVGPAEVVLSAVQQVEFQTRGLESDVRVAATRRYLHNLDAGSVLIGHSERFLGTFRDTLHNSYLMWHRLFGVGALMLATLTLLALARTLTVHPMLALALAVILLRSVTDTVLLPGVYFDPVFGLLGLMALSGRRSSVSGPRGSPVR
jgi:hypothetical protein